MVFLERRRRPLLDTAKDTSNDRRGIRPSLDTSRYRHRDVGYGHSSNYDNVHRVQHSFITPGQRQHVNLNRYFLKISSRYCHQTSNCFDKFLIFTARSNGMLRHSHWGGGKYWNILCGILFCPTRSYCTTCPPDTGGRQ